MLRGALAEAVHYRGCAEAGRNADDPHGRSLQTLTLVATATHVGKYWALAEEAVGCQQGVSLVQALQAAVVFSRQ